MAVIDRNPQRTKKKLFTERGQGKKVVLHETQDDRIEAAYVVDKIASMVGKRQAEPGDFAVMYRTNAQSRILEEAFLKEGLPYRLLGAQRFYGRREVKDIIAYLRLVHNPQDEISLTRVINVPARGIGEKTYQGLRQYASNLRTAPGSLLLELPGQPDDRTQGYLPGRAGVVVMNFAQMLQRWVKQKDDLAPLALMDRIMEDIEYAAYINDGTEEGNDRWENVNELRRLAAEHQDTGLEAFLERVALVSDQDTLGNQTNVPTLLTLHAAKGLEFPAVIIVGLNEGTLPHIRSFDDPEAMMEERRLLYVGITRAKDRLYLVHAQNRIQFGGTEPVEPSRYIDDIPSELLENSQPVRRLRRMDTTASSSAYRWSSPGATTPAPEPEIQRFSPGQKVEHPSWGGGLVLNSRIQDGDEILDIFFEQVGLKRVLASAANLTLKE